MIQKGFIEIVVFSASCGPAGDFRDFGVSTVRVNEMRKGLGSPQSLDAFMAGDARLERATSGSGDQRSIQLS